MHDHFNTPFYKIFFQLVAPVGLDDIVLVDMEFPVRLLCYSYKLPEKLVVTKS